MNLQTPSNYPVLAPKCVVEVDGPLRHNGGNLPFLAIRSKNHPDLTQIDSGGLENQNGPESAYATDPALHREWRFAMTDRILVCGGRDYNDRATVKKVLDQFDIAELIHGGASGADRLASIYASERKIEQTEYKALWTTHGRAAGPIRNQQMLDQGKPDMVIAFPGGRGTDDMIRRAKSAGVPVLAVALPSPHRKDNSHG